jgi:hypothetical protein
LVLIEAANPQLDQQGHGQGDKMFTPECAAIVVAMILRV